MCVGELGLHWRGWLRSGLYVLGLGFLSVKTQTPARGRGL